MVSKVTIAIILFVCFREYHTTTSQNLLEFFLIFLEKMFREFFYWFLQRFRLALLSGTDIEILLEIPLLILPPSLPEHFPVLFQQRLRGISSEFAPGNSYASNVCTSCNFHKNYDGDIPRSIWDPPNIFSLADSSSNFPSCYYSRSSKDSNRSSSRKSTNIHSQVFILWNSFRDFSN